MCKFRSPCHCEPAFQAKQSFNGLLRRFAPRNDTGKAKNLHTALISEFWEGFSDKNLHHMIRFVEVFPEQKIVYTLCRQLRWSHFRNIIFEDRNMFDINKAIKDSHLSKSDILFLQKEIKKDYPHDSMLYELHLIRALKLRAYKKLSRQRKLTFGK